jgi:ADP-ribose pyrophosphatase YjhB (NUDIX family)
MAGEISQPGSLIDIPDDARRYPATPLVGVGALIVQDSRIVLIRRAKPPSAGEWSIPGGLVRLGETLLQAVAREALEETGLQVEPVSLVELLERIFPDKEGRIRHHYVLADFLCRVTGGTLHAGSDASEACWADESSLDEFGLPGITLQVVAKALQNAASL